MEGAPGAACSEAFLMPASISLLGIPGVLLLNAVLTVRAHQATSHKERGWEEFTDAVVAWLNKNLDGVVFMLWGAYAQKKGSAIDRVSSSSLFQFPGGSAPAER